MLDLRKRLGRKGESLAVRYLKKCGYVILETNYRNRLGEIDIIAKDRDVIAFIEVKTRQNRQFVNPKASVTVKKQGQIIRVAQAWLKLKKKSDDKARFDVVAILSDDQTQEIELIKNAFTLTHSR